MKLLIPAILLASTAAIASPMIPYHITNTTSEPITLVQLGAHNVHAHSTTCSSSASRLSNTLCTIPAHSTATLTVDICENDMESGAHTYQDTGNITVGTYTGKFNGQYSSIEKFGIWENYPGHRAHYIFQIHTQNIDSASPDYYYQNTANGNLHDTNINVNRALTTNLIYKAD